MTLPSPITQIPSLTQSAPTTAPAAELRITSPDTELLSVFNCRPRLVFVASISICSTAAVALVALAEPGCEYPSICTLPITATAGRSVAGVIVCGPAPAMLNIIFVGTGTAFAATMAARSEPAPASFVLDT